MELMHLISIIEIYEIRNIYIYSKLENIIKCVNATGILPYLQQIDKIIDYINHLNLLCYKKSVQIFYISSYK